MHKGKGDFIATCGIWVFLPWLSVQDIDAFQSCGVLQGERKFTCWLSIPASPHSNRDLLCYQTLAAYCEFKLRPALHKWWMWAEASKDVATHILGFILFALHLHGGCMKTFLIKVAETVSSCKQMLHHILLSFTMLSLEGKFDPPHSIYIYFLQNIIH